MRPGRSSKHPKEKHNEKWPKNQNFSRCATSPVMLMVQSQHDSSPVLSNLFIFSMSLGGFLKESEEGVFVLPLKRDFGNGGKVY